MPKSIFPTPICDEMGGILLDLILVSLYTVHLSPATPQANPRLEVVTDEGILSHMPNKLLMPQIFLGGL